VAAAVDRHLRAGDLGLGLAAAPRRAAGDEVEDLRNALRLFGADSPEFRRRLDRVLAEHEAMRRRYHLTREQFADAERQNERLVGVLQEAKQQIELLKEEVDKLCAPPNTYGIFQRPNKDGTAEILVDGRPMRVAREESGSGLVEAHGVLGSAPLVGGLLGRELRVGRVPLGLAR